MKRLFFVQNRGSKIKFDAFRNAKYLIVTKNKKKLTITREANAGVSGCEMCEVKRNIPNNHDIVKRVVDKIKIS